MNLKIVLLAALVVSVFLIGCTSNTNGYAAYNQPQGGQQPSNNQYVGGGCGVAPSADYENTPIEALNSIKSVL